MDDDMIASLIATGVIGSSGGSRPLTEKERRKMAIRAQRQAEKKAKKEVKAAANRKLWKKYFGIDADKIHEKAIAKRKAQDEELRKYGYIPDKEQGKADITITIEFS